MENVQTTVKGTSTGVLTFMVKLFSGGIIGLSSDRNNIPSRGLGGCHLFIREAGGQCSGELSGDLQRSGLCLEARCPQGGVRFLGGRVRGYHGNTRHRDHGQEASFSLRAAQTLIGDAPRHLRLRYPTRPGLMSARGPVIGEVRRSPGQFGLNLLVGGRRVGERGFLQHVHFVSLPGFESADVVDVVTGEVHAPGFVFHYD